MTTPETPTPHTDPEADVLSRRASRLNVALARSAGDWPAIRAVIEEELAQRRGADVAALALALVFYNATPDPRTLDDGRPVVAI